MGSLGNGRVRCTRGNQALIADLLFKQPTQLRYDYHDVARQKQLLAEVFAGEAWEVPRLLEKMQTATDLYFDSVSQISHGEVVPRTSGAAGRCRLLPGTALWARVDPGHDGSLYPGGRTESGSGRSSASVSPVRTGLQARGQTGAKNGGNRCQNPGSRNAFGPLDAKSPGPTAAPASAYGNRALERITQEA